MFVPDAAPGGLYGSSAYLAACAKHESARFGTLVAGDVELPALRTDGTVVTPYGYPQPVAEAGTWEAAAIELAAAPFPWRIALAPLGCGAELATALVDIASPVSSRPICVHDLIAETNPVDRFNEKAQAEVRRARRASLRLETSEPTALFGSLYRAAMEATGADPIYSFADDYFAGIAKAGGWQVLAHDDSGPAAGALFIAAAGEATYHLSWRRASPRPVSGCANLLVATALERCRDLGARVCYLGGGVTHSEDDSLFVFKRAMATRIVTRPTFIRP